MGAGNSSAVYLSGKNHTETPKEIQQQCGEIQESDSSRNPRNRRSNAIGCFGNLGKHVIRKSALPDLPDEIGTLTTSHSMGVGNSSAVDISLENSSAVDLRSKQLTKIPKAVQQKCLDIEELDLSENRGIRLRNAIGCFYNLRKLRLISCELRDVPDEIGTLTKLDELDLSFNKFKNGVNPSIGRLHHLKKLRLFSSDLQTIPKSFGDLIELEELDLSRNNFENGVSTSIRRLHHLKKLSLINCFFQNVPEWFGDLEELEELDLSINQFKNGIDPSIGRLHHLKKLGLATCYLQNLPEWFGDLEELEELDLSRNNFWNGVSPSIGRLHHLKKLDLATCYLQNIPEWFGDLEELEELDLSQNEFRKGIDPSIGRLHHLKKLDLTYCYLQNVPDSFGDLEVLEELDLSENQFKNGIHPSIGRLHHLKKLKLRYCYLQNIPESFGDLEELTMLFLQDNCLTEYPSCLFNLKNLTTLDLSNFPEEMAYEPRSGNVISSLPMELAETNLSELHLDGNPITDPPEAIWRQGLDAIKSYFREKRLGAGELCPDTINMIGDVLAGKTSIAQSLVQGSPHPAAEDDRTRVMQQLRAAFGENGKLLVNINDFGGHQIYHCVISIFLPTDGLTILAYDMSLPVKDQKDTVSSWLLTAIAKLKNVRVIVAGTRCDQISQDELKATENRMVQFLSSLFNDVKSEIRRHIYRLEQRSSNPDEKKVNHLRDLLLRLNNADISVVSLSCRENNPGLNELRDKVSKMLRQGDSMPLRWFQVMNSILYASSHRHYLTWSEVQKLYRDHVPDGDGDKDLAVILRYLVSTSQVFWLEHHEMLNEIIFHSPQSIIKVCKDVLSHDHSWQVASQLVDVTDKDRERYLKGIVRQPFMMELISDKESAAVSIEFLKNFNLISEISADDGIRTFVIPSNLPAEEPPLMRDLEQRLHSCPNSVAINLIFLGSMLPMSFFETSLSMMLTIATRHFKDGMSTEQWRHGLIILYDRVCFTANRHKNILTLAAFSEVWTSNPWAILQPIVKGIHESITVSWHGATPESSLLCPACRINRRLERAVGENEITLETLVSKVQHEGAKWMCPKCTETIPPCLCFPLPRDSLTTDELDDLKTFFTKHGMSVSSGVCRPSAKTNMHSFEGSTEENAEHSELIKRLRKATPKLVQELDHQSIMGIVDILLAARDGAGLINEYQRQEIQAEKTDIDKTRKLLMIVCSRGDEAIRELVTALQSDYVRRPDLAKLFLQ